jgi:4'-phosphopantetheinyl transferase
MPFLEPETNQVEVIWTSLVSDDQEIALLNKYLSVEENNQANRFATAQLRQRYIKTRGYLRLLLARYLTTTPESIEFTYNSYGKPSIAWSSLQFNLSHSDQVVVYAFTRVGDIGIDIEKIKPIDNYLEIAKKFLHPQEHLAIASMTNNNDRLRGFYHCWSRKEAIIKAKGLGLAHSLSSFAVSISPHDTTYEIATTAQETCNWSLINLTILPEYASALAVTEKIDLVNIKALDHALDL